MLRIKDNIDLKELEKFGFKYKRESPAQYEHYVYETKTKDDVYPCARCFVLCFNRGIRVNSLEFEILFDLIQAGFVEKFIKE